MQFESFCQGFIHDWIFVEGEGGIKNLLGLVIHVYTYTVCTIEKFLFCVCCTTYMYYVAWVGTCMVTCVPYNASCHAMLYAA